jgi:hypothetical protein
MLNKKYFLLIFLILFLQGCTINSIDNGINYLNKTYDKNFVYNDNYLKFVYPNENLPLNLTYRKIDSYANLIYFKEEIQKDKLKIIQYQVNEAYNNLNSLLPYFENKLTYNTIKNVSDGYALDTYCIVGYLFNNTKIASNVVSLIINNNLVEDNYYREDKWRNMADEAWCILLLNKASSDKNIVLTLTNIKLNETYQFINSENSIGDKVAVLIHSVMILNELSYNNSDIKDKLYKLALQDEIKKNILLEADILYVLSKSDYQKDKLEIIYKLIKEKQNKDGGWYQDKNYGNAFTTQRVILALNAYENNV